MRSMKLINKIVLITA